VGGLPGVTDATARAGDSLDQLDGLTTLDIHGWQQLEAGGGGRHRIS
jgi:hypothetical protein